MTKLTFTELRDQMIQFNKENKFTCKGTLKKLKAVIVFTEDSFDKFYPLESRSYLVTNDNKGFFSNMFSNSIFGNALDGTDNGVRLDWYIWDSENPWKVDYCYILEESEV